MPTLCTDTDTPRLAERARLYRERNPAFAAWAQGYGVIRHDARTQCRLYDLAELLVVRGLQADLDTVFAFLQAADRLSAMGCWLVGHMTYARHIHLDGRALGESDFKLDPQGHTGGSLNMVPAYVAYLTANALGHFTRGWVMGQGHCVAAIDAVNVLTRNLTPEHEARYSWDDAGLTNLTKDFYHYRVAANGRPESPLGSHVNVYTAGGILEGGYLGFADLQYVHMPLPGERLVAFLSDGAFEEQRGADWAGRWWRNHDSGLVVPVMIANGRRIEQRTTMYQLGGVDWFRDHLAVNGFDPIVIDGTDPAAFVWALFEAEERLAAAGEAAENGLTSYPVAMPYVIAEAPKGFGFPNAGTNLAHGTPIASNPGHDAQARELFNTAAQKLWVDPASLAQATALLNNHATGARPRERDNPLAQRQVAIPARPTPRDYALGQWLSPMRAVDEWLDQFFAANPGLRPRLGNPDELRSNRLDRVLDRLQHRVPNPEAGNAEAVEGAVITALNEEAVVCSALANKGGLNLVVSYEAFAVKMLGALRQEIIFARHQLDAGRQPGWISLPVIATSHTWENGKNEQSHQDPTLCEALLGEMSDVSRVLFPADAASAVAALHSVYGSQGRICILVIPKQDMPLAMSAAQARRLAEQGALLLEAAEHPQLELVATGAYQLLEARRAAARLREKGLTTALIYLQEPGRFREGRDARERDYQLSAVDRAALFSPAVQARLFISHTRPEALLGVVRPLDLGPERTAALGYRNRGGTLDVGGLLYANACTWAHLVVAALRLLGRDPADFLSEAEWLAVQGRGDPYALIPEPHAMPRGN